MNISQVTEYNSYPPVPWPEYGSCPPAAYGSPYREYSFALSSPAVTASINAMDASATSVTNADSGTESELVSFAVKVISPSKKSEYKTYMLKNIDVTRASEGERHRIRVEQAAILVPPTSTTH